MNLLPSIPLSDSLTSEPQVTYTVLTVNEYFFQENMFSFEVEKEKYALKPMNCPGHW